MSIPPSTTTRSALPSLPLESKEPFIRLLELHPTSDSTIACSLSVHRLDEAPDFYALSYCWGSEDEGYPIVCNGATMTVRRNLYEGLKQLRKTQYRLLWIDQICIDQSDTPEKNHQVALMSQIYSRALMTVVWLGQAHPYQSRITEYIQKLSHATHLAEKSSLELGTAEVAFLLEGTDLVKLGLPHWNSGFEPLLAPLCDFFMLPYWSRVWVIQECALAKDVRFIQGPAEYRFEAIENMLSILPGIRAWKYYSIKSKFWRIMDLFKVRDCVRRKSKCDVVINSTEALCHDPRDKAFALVGILDKLDLQLPRTFHFDYSKPIEEVFFMFAHALLLGEKFGLDILLTLRPSDLIQLDLPSWVPGFRSTNQTNLLFLRVEQGLCDWCSSGSLATELDFHGKSLRLTGHDFDKIVAVSGYIADVWSYGPSETSLNVLGSAATLIRSTLQSRFDVCPQDGQYVTGETAMRAFWQTSSVERGGQVIEQASNASAWTSETSRLIEMLKPVPFSAASSASTHTPLPHADPRQREREQNLYARGEAIAGWCLDTSMKMACTRKGYYCQVPWKAEVDDSIILCKGSRTPFAARPTETSSGTRWQLWGGCYVHGIMYGEAWQPERAQHMWFD